MGKRIEQLDQFAEQLKGHGFTEAMRIVYRTTQRTEKAIAAADKALMMARIAKLEAQLAEREDWVLVPKISTSKMDRAGEDAYEGSGYCDCGNANGCSMEKVFAAMCAAAPTLPASPVSKQG